MTAKHWLGGKAPIPWNDHAPDSGSFQISL